MRKGTWMVVALLALLATTVHGQVTREVRPFVGAYVPTGDQADVLKSAFLMGAQVGLEMADRVHLVGTLAYATPRPDRPALGNDLHLFQYDVGAEVFRLMPIDNGWTFRPFVGAGLGARTHDFYDVEHSNSETYLAGYGALGAELQMGAVALRLEARDYVTRFKGLTGEERAKARNDLMLGLGAAFHLW